MKNLCFLLLLLAGTAHADYWSYPTKDKGEIVLTLEQFSKDHIAKNCRGWYAAYVIDKFNRVIYGCWLLSNDKINVHYTDGDFRVYEKSGKQRKMSQQTSSLFVLCIENRRLRLAICL